MVGLLALLVKSGFGVTNTVQENRETRSTFLLGADDGENDDDDKNGGLRRESSFADEGIVCLDGVD